MSYTHHVRSEARSVDSPYLLADVVLTLDPGETDSSRQRRRARRLS